MIVLQLFAVLFLVGMNAFFAAAEFSLVAVRSSRVRQLVEAGDPRAKIVELLLADVGRIVSAVQVGITIASLLLGYLGEVTLSAMLSPLVAAIQRPWAAVIAHGAALILAHSSAIPAITSSAATTFRAIRDPRVIQPPSISLGVKKSAECSPAVPTSQPLSAAQNIASFVRPRCGFLLLRRTTC